MGREELREKLFALEEVRKMAKRELEAIRSCEERLEALEQDKNALLEYYAEMTPEALDSLTPEERHRVYGMLGLGATIKMDGTLEVSGTFDEGASLCGLETRYSML